MSCQKWQKVKSGKDQCEIITFQHVDQFIVFQINCTLDAESLLLRTWFINWRNARSHGGGRTLAAPRKHQRLIAADPLALR